MAVTMAVAGTASAATIDQFRMGAKTTVYGGERKATLQQADKELKQPSAYLVQLNAQPTSFALSGTQYDRQRAQQLHGGFWCLGR